MSFVRSGDTCILWGNQSVSSMAHNCCSQSVQCWLSDPVNNSDCSRHVCGLIGCVSARVLVRVARERERERERVLPYRLALSESWSWTALSGKATRWVIWLIAGVEQIYQVKAGDLIDSSGVEQFISWKLIWLIAGVEQILSWSSAVFDIGISIPHLGLKWDWGE